MAAQDFLAAHFERLCDLEPEVQRVEIDKLELSQDEQQQLARLLAADRSEGDPIRQAIAEGAAHLEHPPTTRFGAWRLVRELGAGGMGTVFLAERVEGRFEQYVAIKLLRGFPTSESMRRLRQERQILAGLDHPNIARLLDGGESEEDQPWLAMEYVAGLPLLDYVRLHAPLMRDRLGLIDAMLAAIEHAHQHLIIHRDLKPANALVNDAGVIKLLDFGIARLIEAGENGQRSTSTRVFSLGYASPEQQRGDKITTASDIYSLGVMLRELLTGEREIGGKRNPLIVPLALDADMAGIIAKATSAIAEERYSGAREFRDDLDRYREGRPVRAAPLTRRYRLRKFVGRHRLGVMFAMIAMAVLAAFVWRLDRERDRALRAEAIAQQALAASEQDAASARAALNFLTDAFSAASPDSAMNTQVRVRDLLDAARTQLQVRSGGDARFTQRMQRLLGPLYAQLGEARMARDLLGAGLAGVVPSDPADALQLAADYEEYSIALGMLEENAASQAAAETAAKWRQRYAPNDLSLRIRSLQMLGMVSHRSGNDTQAIERLREAFTLGAEKPAVATDIKIESAQLLASLLATRGDCDEALEVAGDGLAQAKAGLPADSPSYLPLMRSQASALNACGRPAEAEPILRAAIAMQERVVAGGGARMMVLTNDLALTLNDLGRYQEAVEMLGRSDQVMAELRLGKIDEALSWANRAGIFENAGDYSAAMAAIEKSAALLDADHVDADHQVRRRIERSIARTWGLIGWHDRAWTKLTALRARSLQLDGQDSGEYAMLTWQLALLAGRMGDPVHGVPLLDESEALWGAMVPPTHAIFAHALRLRASFAVRRHAYAAAGYSLELAISMFESGAASEVDLAIARSELAELRADEHHPVEARQLLSLALPILHSTLLPQELNRARAERLATRLGFRS